MVAVLEAGGSNYRPGAALRLIKTYLAVSLSGDSLCGISLGVLPFRVEDFGLRYG